MVTRPSAGDVKRMASAKTSPCLQVASVNGEESCGRSCPVLPEERIIKTSILGDL